MKAIDKADGNNRKIVVKTDGPYEVSGSVPLAKEIMVTDAEGTPLRWEHGKEIPTKETYYLCRCGHSGKKPFCDGSHMQKGFDGTETATREPHQDQAELTSGPGLLLSDVVGLCALARFCHRDGDAWTLTEKSQDPNCKKTAIEEACDCPSGRLIARDPKTGEPFEPEFAEAIGIIENPHTKLSGPLWVKGRIPIEGADGKAYEVRNRMTLCRCGRSKNKPFCDGSHIAAGFKDDDVLTSGKK